MIMNRKGFFKTLIGTAAAAVVAPTLLKDSLAAQPKPIVAVDVASIPDGVSVDEIICIWRQTGELPHYLSTEYFDGPPYYNIQVNGELVEAYKNVSAHDILNLLSNNE